MKIGQGLDPWSFDASAVVPCLIGHESLLRALERSHSERNMLLPGCASVESLECRDYHSVG